MFEENIVAISTPSGKGGIGIVRMSGKNPLSIAEKMFFPHGKTPVSEFEPYRMYTGKIDGGNFTDYGLCVYFKAPKSYTGEDIVEFQCHGGESVVRGVLKRAISLGAVPAGRGEFTRRAFLNGKLSLSSAEGIADMINGDSEAEVRAGYLLYSEKLTDKVKEFQTELKNALAWIDVSVDYPEEGEENILSAEIKEKLMPVYQNLQSLCEEYASGKKVKTGVSVAICGKPNTGKSSLLNRLLGYEKAIVSEYAGTTRDAVEGTMEIHGVKFNLYDTAGVRESEDKIESIGIDKAESIIRGADVAVFVADLSEGVSEEDARVLELIKDKPLIKVFNKVDLTSDDTPTDADVHTSAKTGEGIKRLAELIYEKGWGQRSEDAAFLIEERHYFALQKAKDALKKAMDDCEKEPLDLVGILLTEAWQTLGEITGETASEAVVEEIFSKFCVGK